MIGGSPTSSWAPKLARRSPTRRHSWPSAPSLCGRSRIKRALGEVEAPSELIEAITASGFEPLDMSAQHADRAGSLTDHHRDPFDRMLVAQAQIEGLVIVTRDEVFRHYDVPTLRC